MMWLALLLALFWLAIMPWGRSHLAQVPVLAPSDETWDDHVFLVAEGVELDEATRRAAAAHARSRGIRVLDLVPADLQTERLTIFAAMYEPEKARMLFSPGRTARVAMAVARDVAERAGIEERSGILPPELADLARRLKSYAARSFDAAVAPDLRTNAEPPGWRMVMQRDALGMLNPFYMAFELGLLVLLGLTVVFAPRWGIVALLMNHLAPLVAVAGSPFRPRDIVPTVLFRTPINLWRWLRMAFGPSLERDRTPEEIREKRPRYEERIARGIDKLFEPRRTTCPLCESDRLETYLEVPDMLQHKPGEFTLERCAACGHVFQNPRLNLDGLDFYYGDFYDGLGKRQTEAIFGIGDDARYLARARVVKGHAEPAAWLDVGGGYGHFCLAAKDVWPETRFDGLDLSDGVEEGVRRGWIEHGYRGLFPELCTEIPKYDVVSMSHYLEHTREPTDEIRAAACVLKEGGLLLIEMPNGVATTGKLLGRYWLPFFQPQHQHLLSLHNLERLLRESGFEIVERQWAEAHSSGDYTGAAYLLIKQLAGPGEAPWLPQRSLLQRLRYRSGWTLFTPLIPLGYVLDKLFWKRSQTLERSNAYRLLARRTAARVAAPA
jgi:SAM-dependent methyltransferase